MSRPKKIRTPYPIGATPNKDAASARFDALSNVSTGLGGLSDKATHTVWGVSYAHPGVLDAMYQSDTITGRIVEQPPRDALAQGWEIESEGEMPWRSPTAMTDWLRARRVVDHLRYAVGLARLYGGAGIVLLIDDGRDPSEPVDWEHVRDVRLSKARDRWELTPIEWFDDFREPRYGQPRLYALTPRSYGGATIDAPDRVHADRLLRFDGYDLPPEPAAANQWWGGSVVWRARQRIERFIAAEQGMALILQEYKEDVLFFKDLAELLKGPDGESSLEARVDAMMAHKGMLSATILDADDRYETRTRSLQGLGDLYDRFMLSVAHAAEMPVTLIFGDAARGLSADDKAGRTYYASAIRALQDEQLTGALEQLLTLAFASEAGPTDGEVARGWSIAWPPYESEDEGAAAATAKTVAEADAINISNGVYTAEDVRRARYVSGATGQILVDVEGETPTGIEPDAGVSVDELASTVAELRAKIEQLTTPRALLDAPDARTPPKAAQANAARALEVRASKPESERAMTATGLARARDLSNGRPLSPETIRTMSAWFARHEVDKVGETWDEQGKGWQAWMGWGGDEAKAWADRLVAQWDREASERQDAHAPTSMMIALYPEQDMVDALASMGLAPDSPLHLTLMVLDPLDPTQQARAAEIMRECLADVSELVGEITGPAIFNAGDECVVLLYGCVGLAALRTRLAERLAAEGLWTPQKYDFTPHLTLGYATGDALLDLFARARAATEALRRPWRMVSARAVGGDEVIATHQLAQPAPRMDPYVGADDPNLPEHVRAQDAATRRRWARVFNAVFVDEGEGAAMRIANASIADGA